MYFEVSSAGGNIQSYSHCDALCRHSNEHSFFSYLLSWFYCGVLGHPAKETVQLVNEENIPFTFSFSESSCHTEGYASSLSVEPMSGTVQPKSRYVNIFFFLMYETSFSPDRPYGHS